MKVNAHDLYGLWTMDYGFGKYRSIFGSFGICIPFFGRLPVAGFNPSQLSPAVIGKYATTLEGLFVAQNPRSGNVWFATDSSLLSRRVQRSGLGRHCHIGRIGERQKGPLSRQSRDDAKPMVFTTPLPQLFHLQKLDVLVFINQIVVFPFTFYQEHRISGSI